MKSTKKATCALMRVLLLVLILSLALTSCGQVIEEPVEEPVDPREVLPDEWRYGFNFETGINDENLVISACSGNRYYDIDNVEITLYYGIVFHPDLETHCKYEMYGTADIYMVDWIRGEDPHAKKQLIHQMSDQLSTEEYSVTVKRNSHGYLTEASFNHSEQIKVPREYLSRDWGFIRIYIYTNDLCYKEDPYTKMYANEICFVYMKISDSTVMLLSTKEYGKYYADQ